VAAVIVTAVVDGRPGLADLGRRVVRWRIGWAWWAVVAGTLGLALLGVVVPLATGGDVPGLAAFTGYTGIGGAITPFGVVLVALGVNGLGEETGWRGFAADRLLRDHRLPWTALVVGLGWAGWHLPFFWLVGGFRTMGPLAVGWLVGLLAGSVVLTFLYRDGRRSILLVAAWHTAYNLVSGTAAAGAVVGTVTSMLVILWAVWILRRERAAASAAGDGGDHRDLRAVRSGGRQPLEEADVLVPDVDVHEPPQLAGLVQDPRLDAGVVPVQVVEDGPQGLPFGRDLGGATGVGAQDRGDADVDAHGSSSGFR
jgi:membrane protease YdiL (CAAX protease family)